MDRNLTEDAIWQASFPHLYALGQRQGSYTIPDKELMIKALQSGFMLIGEKNNAILRLDMVIACLWPQVCHLFAGDVFPHRLAAATDILRMLNFGEGKPEEVQKLVSELSHALDGLEQLLQRQDAADRAEEAVRMAAEPGPGDTEK